MADRQPSARSLPDAPKAGVFVLTGDSGVVHDNGSARNLDDDQAFRIDNGKLVPREAAARTALAEALAAACSGDVALGSGDPSFVFRTVATRR